MNLVKENWTRKDYEDFISYLKSIGNQDYIKFSKKIIKEETNMLGIKVPILKEIAKEIVKGNYKSFLQINKNIYYEELFIEGLIIGYIKEKRDFDLYLDRFVKKIDNWAICDTSAANMKRIKKNQDVYLPQIIEYAKSKEEYIVRFALVCLLDHYKEDKYINIIFQIINSVTVDTYYVNMSIAWLLCEMFIHHKEQTLKFLNNLKINTFTFNKFISKCCDSYRVSKEDKMFLKALKNSFEK